MARTGRRLSGRALFYARAALILAGFGLAAVGVVISSTSESRFTPPLVIAGGLLIGVAIFLSHALEILGLIRIAKVR